MTVQLRRACAFLLILGCVLHGQIANANDLPDAEIVADHFLNIALGQSRSARVVKWTSAPRIRLETFEARYKDGTTEPDAKRIETSKAHYEAMKRVAEDMSALTGLPIRVLPRGLTEGGDIVVSIMSLRLMAQISLPGVSETTMRRLRGPGRCFFVAWPGAESNIVKARIFINAWLSDTHITHCFYEEIIQSMGLPHDTRKIAGSIFNDGYLGSTLSHIDRHLIQILYDPRMPLGIGRAAAREHAISISRHIRQ